MGISIMQVEMEHNPYQGSLQVLVNGQPRNRLSSYANKPFTSWFRDIFSLIDGETNEPYNLILTAGDAESKIISGISYLSKYCNSVTVKPHSLTIPIAERIKAIHGISKKNNYVRFCILPSLQNIITEKSISALINNQVYQNDLWNTKIEYCQTGNLSNNPNDIEYLFFLAKTQGELSNALLSSARRGYYSTILCVLIDGMNKVDYLGSNLLVHCKHSDWQVSVLNSLQTTLIGDCFWDVYQNVSESNLKSNAFEIKEQAKIILPKYIELDCEEKIDIQSPSGYVTEVDVTVRNPAIISSFGHMLRGVKPGTTNVQVFERGTYRLLASADVEVKYISRIKELFAKDIGLRHGDILKIEQHDSASVAYDYAPDDAVDVSNIRWSSSDTTIARVHSLSGRITGINPGNCEIHCNVVNGKSDGFVIKVVVIPIPQKLELPDIYRNELVLNEGESFTFKPVVIPPMAKYDGFSIHINDTSIAEVKDSLSVLALREGETTLVIMENHHNTSLSITLKVIHVQGTQKRTKGLLSKFFR